MRGMRRLEPRTRSKPPKTWLWAIIAIILLILVYMLQSRLERVSREAPLVPPAGVMLPGLP